MPYDYLVLAPGAVDHYFGRSGWRTRAPGMKEAQEATFSRARLLRSFERAATKSDAAERAALPGFVIVGGAPSGVKLAGAVTVLIGFRNRLAVLSSWIYSYVFFRRGPRLISRTMAPAQGAR